MGTVERLTDTLMRLTDTLEQLLQGVALDAEEVLLQISLGNRVKRRPRLAFRFVTQGVWRTNKQVFAVNW